MPDPGMDPLFESWPVCASRMSWFDLDLTCVLPRGHERDGSDFHRDERGNEWKITDE